LEKKGADLQKNWGRESQRAHTEKKGEDVWGGFRGERRGET